MNLHIGMLAYIQAASTQRSLGAAGKALEDFISTHPSSETRILKMRKLVILCLHACIHTHACTFHFSTCVIENTNS